MNWLGLLLALSAAEGLALAQEPLTLQDAVREALAASPVLAAAREDAALAGLEEPLLLANLDPVFESQATTGEDKFPRDSPAFQGPFARQQTFDVGIRQQTLLGTTARLSWTNKRIQNPAAFRAIDPSVESRLGLEVSQPLLRYFWGRPDVARRKRARAGVEAARGRLRQAETDAAAGAAAAFVELAQAREQTLIREKALADSKRLLSKHEEKRRYGMVEDSDLLQAQVSVELAETELELARAQQALAVNALLSALRREGEPPSLTAADAPAPPLAGEALQRALLERGDVRAARANAERADWNARVERLDTLPDLTVFGAYAFGGLGGRWRPAYDDLRGWDHPAKQGGLNLSVPFGGTRERLARRGAEARARAALSQQQAAEQQAKRETADAFARLALAETRDAAGERLAELEARKHRAEEENYGRGRSTTDLLLRFQSDVRRAQSLAVRAHADLQLARIEALRATGTLLEALPPAPSR